MRTILFVNLFLLAGGETRRKRQQQRQRSSEKSLSKAVLLNYAHRYSVVRYLVLLIIIVLHALLFCGAYFTGLLSFFFSLCLAFAVTATLLNACRLLCELPIPRKKLFVFLWKDKKKFIKLKPDTDFSFLKRSVWQLCKTNLGIYRP
jgi:hypothetical protein